MATDAELAVRPSAIFYGTFQIIFDCRIVITGIVKLIRQSVQSFTDQILIGRLVGIGIQTAVPRLPF